MSLFPSPASTARQSDPLQVPFDTTARTHTHHTPPSPSKTALPWTCCPSRLPTLPYCWHCSSPRRIAHHVFPTSSFFPSLLLDHKVPYLTYPISPVFDLNISRPSAPVSLYCTDPRPFEPPFSPPAGAGSLASHLLTPLGPFALSPALRDLRCACTCTSVP